MPGASRVKETQTPESQLPSNPEQTDQLETIWEPYKNRYRVLAVSLAAFGNGMNDAANGALIESLEK